MMNVFELEMNLDCRGQVVRVMAFCFASLTLLAEAKELEVEVFTIRTPDHTVGRCLLEPAGGNRFVYTFRREIMEGWSLEMACGRDDKHFWERIVWKPASPTQKSLGRVIPSAGRELEEQRRDGFQFDPRHRVSPLSWLAHIHAVQPMTKARARIAEDELHFRQGPWEYDVRTKRESSSKLGQDLLPVILKWNGPGGCPLP